jgi:hypothetical protein
MMGNFLIKKLKDKRRRKKGRKGAPNAHVAEVHYL